MDIAVCCAACQRAKIKTTKDLSWCVNCAELICSTCATFHLRFKNTCGHKLLNVSEKEAVEIASSVISQNCKEHPNEQFAYLCRNHDTFCCNACVISKHGKCKTVEETEKLGKVLKGSHKMEVSMEKIDKNLKCLQFGIDTQRKSLEAARIAFKDDLVYLRDQINEVIERFELNILSEFNFKAKEVEAEVTADTQILNKLREQSRQLATILRVHKNMATNTQFLILNRDLETQLKELDTAIKELSSRGIKKLDWALESVLSDIELAVKNNKLIICLEKTSFTTLAESTTVAIKEHRVIKPFFVRVEILEDNRILILDHCRCILRLLDSDLKQTCQIFIKGARQLAAVNKSMIVVCLDDCKLLRFFKLSGKVIAPNGELHTNINSFFILKYRDDTILLSSKDKPEEPHGLYPKEIDLKLLKQDKTISDFNFPVSDKISPWRGFVFDSHSDRFVAVSEDGTSLLWLNKSGSIMKEKKIDGIGRGGLSGLTVDNCSRIYAASTRKIFEINETGNVQSIFDARINVYSIAVAENGDKIIAVGHDHEIEVFTLYRVELQK